MSALERLGRHVAESGRARVSDAARELVELHLVDTVGALIASTRTVEGASLLRFRAAMRARGQGACALDLSNASRLVSDPARAARLRACLTHPVESSAFGAGSGA